MISQYLNFFTSNPCLGAFHIPWLSQIFWSTFLLVPFSKTSINCFPFRSSLLLSEWRRKHSIIPMPVYVRFLPHTGFQLVQKWRLRLFMHGFTLTRLKHLISLIIHLPFQCRLPSMRNEMYFLTSYPTQHPNWTSSLWSPQTTRIPHVICSQKLRGNCRGSSTRVKGLSERCEEKETYKSCWEAWLLFLDVAQSIKEHLTELAVFCSNQTIQMLPSRQSRPITYGNFCNQGQQQAVRQKKIPREYLWME